MFEFLKFLKFMKHKLVIDNGRVYCPIRGHDTDIDICAACPRLREMDTSANPSFVSCRLDAHSPPETLSA